MTKGSKGSKIDNAVLFAMLLPRVEKMMDNFSNLMEREANRPHTRDNEFELKLSEFKLKSLKQLDERVQELLTCEDSQRQERLRDEIRTLREISSRY